MGCRILEPLFPLGDVYLTAGVAALELDPDEIGRLLHRHQCGDWGDLDEEDKAANDLDLREGGRLLSPLRNRRGKFCSNLAPKPSLIHSIRRRKNFRSPVKNPVA